MPLRSKLDIRISHLLLIKTSLSPNLLKLFLLCVTLSSNHHIEVCCKDTNVTLCTPWKTSTTSRAFHPRMSFGCFLWLSYLQKKTGRADEITLASRRMQNLPLECMGIVSLCFVFFFLIHFHRLMVHWFFATFHLLWGASGWWKGAWQDTFLGLPNAVLRFICELHAGLKE